MKIDVNVGDKFNTQTGQIEVIEVDRQNVRVRFDDGYEVIAQKCNVVKGSVRNPNFRSYFGIGYRGVGRHTMYGKKSYHKWNNMMVRCYDPEYKKLHPTYDDVYCCDEWHNYQNFTEWYLDQIGCDEKGYDLDKDLLVKGNKVYSPDTCVLVPQELNKILGNTGINRGVSTRPDLNGKWMVRCSTVDGEVYLGLYGSKELALQVYRDFKLSYLKERATFWKDKIDPRVFNALMEFTFEALDLL